MCRDFYMRTCSFFIGIFLCSLTVAQENFTINGKIEMLSKARQINLGSSWGMFIGEILPDGSFTIHGKVESPGTALIYTDSSGADAIWLEQGVYNIKCKEIKLDSLKGIYFRTPELRGPADAEIYNAYSQSRYYFRGTSDEKRKKFKEHCIKYLDSLFNKAPKSKIITIILRDSRLLIGDEAVQIYMSKLNEELLAEHDYLMLQNYFKRKEKIENEKYIKDFQMKNLKGKVFKLSSLNKKLILLDFWSSDCAPCRRKHPRLAELYKKYADKGFEIISVSLDDNKKEWKKAAIKDKMVWINISELKGWRTTLAEDYFVKSIPFSIWLDENKRIISIYDLSDKEIEEYLK